ncbi:hypothetical protein CWI37_0081p0010 [Hamiltosporidium tvaerminnensis]|uniref:Uncharacterized protein n=1 Tax=Hamiltosporidium tvaerminnensis TaxID=1176355 RepID=A0A4Q9LCQ2_9MICR|nr:hypothetical protein CWI37_0081p0010 [Hamiltosporidium tvaerminnensis]
MSGKDIGLQQPSQLYTALVLWPDIVFNVLKDNKDIYSNSIATETECLCQIKRGSILDTKVIDCFKEMLFRNENRQYNHFEPFEKLKDMNSNIEIFLCQHIKETHLNFNFTLPENHIIESEPNPVSLQNLFQNFDLVSIKKLNLEWLSITKSDSHALNNLLNLEQLKIEMICLNNIFFSELFCISTEYKIKECI